MATAAQLRAARERLGKVESDDAERAAAIRALGDAVKLAAGETAQVDVAKELHVAASQSRFLLRFLRHKKYDQPAAVTSLISHFRYMRAFYDMSDGEELRTCETKSALWCKSGNSAELQP